MKPTSSSIMKGLNWLFAILVPLSLLLSATRLVLTPTLVRLEYLTPNFPADTYGFSLEDRVRYAPLALDYLLNDEDISFLADQTFVDGSPLYNERELGHMQDVKDLTQTALITWQFSLLILIAIGLWAWRSGWLDDFKGLLARGGRITVMLIAAILLFAALSFNVFFTAFHGIFFDGDTWLFLFSDTLIRLFPIRFWRDVIMFMGGLTLLGGAILWRLFGIIGNK
jgi:integral membrane protein (TIGR01906 family)